MLFGPVAPSNLPIFQTHLSTSLMQHRSGSLATGAQQCVSRHSIHPTRNKCTSPVVAGWMREGHRFRLPAATNLQCNRKQLNLHKTRDHRQLASSAFAGTSLNGWTFHGLRLHAKLEWSSAKLTESLRTTTVAR